MGTQQYGIPSNPSVRARSASPYGYGGAYRPPKLREFDLKVGDRIKVREHASPYCISDEAEAKSTTIVNYYTVTGIYPHVFTCERSTRKSLLTPFSVVIKTSFMKKDYQLGEIEKVVE